MAARTALPGMIFALCCLAATTGLCGAASGPGAPRAFSQKALDAVVPGRSTKRDVEALLGQPWRTVESDPDESDPEIWEYRGTGPNGTYRVHIEFDDHGTASLIAEIPDNATSAPARVAPRPAAAAQRQK